MGGGVCLNVYINPTPYNPHIDPIHPKLFKWRLTLRTSRKRVQGDLSVSSLYDHLLPLGGFVGCSMSSPTLTPRAPNKVQTSCK